MMFNWDKLWKWFDWSFKDLDREMQQLENKAGKVKLIYENGHLEIRVDGVLKSITLNGKKLTVVSKVKEVTLKKGKK